MTMFGAKKHEGTTFALEGEISTFSQLDPTLPWINLETEEDASSDELGDIPDHLRPNLRKCQFYFDVASHKLFFLTTARKGGISPSLMARYLKDLFSFSEVVLEFGEVGITVLPDRDSISRIIGWKKIRRLQVHAERPNPGDYDPDELEEFEQSLAEQNASQLNFELVAEKNKSLILSEKTKTLVAIAADNGFVEAKGYNSQGAPEERSTKTGKPFSDRGEYNDDAETYWDAFLRIAKAAARKFAVR
jgi:hypothetical protein